MGECRYVSCVYVRISVDVYVCLCVCERMDGWMCFTDRSLFSTECHILVNSDDSKFYRGRLKNMKIIDLQVRALCAPCVSCEHWVVWVCIVCAVCVYIVLCI